MIIRLLAALLLTLLALPAQAQEMSAAPDWSTAFVAMETEPILPEDFITVEGLYARVHGAPRDRRVVTRLADHAAEAVPRIAEQLGVGSGSRMHIVLADDQEAFEELQPGEPPGWADGTAYPLSGLIYLRSPRVRPGTAAPLEQVLEHEITHVLLGQAFGPRPVPRWLQEGMAQWVAGEYGPETIDRIANGMAAGGLLTLEQLKFGFPPDPFRAELAYAQSADLIAWIASEYGEESLVVLVGELSSGTPVNAAFRAATGEFADDLDAAWRARLNSSGLWLKAVTADWMWMGLGAPILLLGWLGVKRRNRIKLERWRREEALQEALYRAIERGMRPPPAPERVAPWWTRDQEGPWVH